MNTTTTVNAIAAQIWEVLARHDAAITREQEARRRALATFLETAAFDSVTAAALTQLGLTHLTFAHLDTLASNGIQ